MKSIVMKSVIEVRNTETFRQLLKSELPVVAEFWAERCGACRYMKPVFERFAERYAMKAKFAEVNTEEAPQLSHYIEYLPTFLVYRNGQITGQIVGATSFDEFRQEIEPLILDGKAASYEEGKMRQMTLTPKTEQPVVWNPRD